MDSSIRPPKNGIELRAWRLANGFTQHQTAMAVGTSQCNVSIWERTNATLHRTVLERLWRLANEPGYHLAEAPLPYRKPGRERTYDDRNTLRGDDALRVLEQTKWWKDKPK